MGQWIEIVVENYAEVLPGYAFDSTLFCDKSRGIPLIRIRDLKKLETEINFYGKYPGRYLVSKNDILIGMDGDFHVARWNGKTALLNQRVCKVIPKQGLHDGLLYYLLIGEILKIQNQATGTTVKHLSNGDIAKIKLKIPQQNEEQIAISNILTLIDKSIRKTEQLISKYEQIKTGLMQDLLTRGIDSEGNIRNEETHEFKDSVLGRIPVDWEVTSLKAACERIQDGTHFSPEISEVGEFMYITSKNIRLGELDLRNVDYITREAHESIYRRCSVEFGDVLLTKDGANTGNVCLNTIKEPISLLSSVAFLRGKSGVLSNDFLFQMLSSEKLQKTFKDQMSGNAITRTTLTKINATQIAIPKIDEQNRIESILARYDSNLLIEKSNLIKSQALKTALMQDLLTGRVRVDNLASKNI